MVIIADSGSTKTHWCVLNGDTVIKEIFTTGINPFYQTKVEISHDIELNLLPKLKDFSIESIFFYGAGCAFPDKKKIIVDAIGGYFKDVVIEVESDLLAAARSLFQNEKGIACIMGTGSNSCFYDGESIVENVSPLGFILGDEGSGAVLGKQLISDCLKKQLPVNVIDRFFAKYELTPAVILENVYKQPFPNRFLAKFTPFLLENIAVSSIFNIVYNGFDAFFVRNVKQYSLDDVKVGVVGSVAFYFKETLEIVAAEHQIKLAEVVQSPMAGLVKYHSTVL